MAKSTLSTVARKAASKPAERDDFPLFVHKGTGRWCKKVLGRFAYFGKVADDPDGAAALVLWNQQRKGLEAGQKQKDLANGDQSREGLTVNEGVNLFLHAKKRKLDDGEIVPSTWSGYQMCCRRIKKFFGANRIIEDLRPADFENYLRDLSKTNGLVGRANQIRVARMVFGYLHENEHIEKSIRFGSEFKQPDAKLIRKQRKSRMYESYEVRRMLDAAGPVMKAMILLAVNCGFGNADVGRLQRNVIDEKNGWVVFPRPKTGSYRRIPLWPETLEALKEAHAARPKAASTEYSDHVFLTAGGEPYHKDGASYLSEQFRWFLMRLDEHDENEAKRLGADAPAKLYRAGTGFYTFRHVFETIGGESLDQVAVDAIMGHQRGDMASVYRERLSDERLVNVINTVRAWLWPDESQAELEPEADSDSPPSTVPFRVVG